MNSYFIIFNIILFLNLNVSIDSITKDFHRAITIKDIYVTIKAVIM